jgi:hypothetical protein
MSGPKLTGGRCQCTACSGTFSNVREFDRHRIGSYAEAGEWAHKRRCLTPAEMDAAGWIRNARGFRMKGRLGRAPADIQGPRVTLPATHAPGADDAALFRTMRAS